MSFKNTRIKPKSGVKVGGYVIKVLENACDALVMKGCVNNINDWLEACSERRVFLDAVLDGAGVELMETEEKLKIGDMVLFTFSDGAHMKGVVYELDPDSEMVYFRLTDPMDANGHTFREGSSEHDNIRYFRRINCGDPKEGVKVSI